ncbi:hypothetical protein [Plantactinospora sp. CA-290183]|uniref:hypothetical protein n=1 Tax=Plantactinospora sp. CA-290183 TaxID=3240006 RepID=UPI003D8B695E
MGERREAWFCRLDRSALRHDDADELSLYLGRTEAPGWTPVRARDVTDVPGADGHYRLQVIGSLPVTDGELRRWNEAAEASLRELAGAEGDLSRVRDLARTWRHIRMVPLAGARLRRRERLGEERFRQRFRAVAAAYLPVRREVEERLAQRHAERQEKLRRGRERAEASRRAYQASFDAYWARFERFDAAARLPLWSYEVRDGTAYVSVAPSPTSAVDATELAGTLLGGPVEWAEAARRAAEQTVGAGEFDSWWRRVDGRVRNQRARDEAVALVVEAIDGTCRALEAAGRPDLVAITGDSSPRQSVLGWQVGFDCSALTVAPPVVPPPPLPLHQDSGGRWWYRTFDKDHGRPGHGSAVRDVVLAAGRPRGGPTGQPYWFPDGYRVAETRTDGYTDYTRHRRRWEFESPQRFAAVLFEDEVRYWSSTSSHRGTYSFRLAEFADPAEFGPFVRVVARVVADGFLRLVSS